VYVTYSRRHGVNHKNFYSNYAKVLQFYVPAVKLQELLPPGELEEAAATLPKELIDACHSVGPAERPKERL